MKKSLQDYFESNEFSVYLVVEENKVTCAELETWTTAGVNMLFYLRPFSAEAFIECVKSFDVDEEIRVHMTDKSYQANFTFARALDDFNLFKSKLDAMASELEAIYLKP